MWTTFLVALKANLRNRQALFWMIVFPIVLATMFNGFFGGLSEGYELKPIPMAVVEDSRWQQADGARTFVDALSGETASSSESLDGTAYADINQQLLTITAADTVRKAEQLLADGTVRGYLAADGNGRLAITISRETVTAANDTTGSVGLDISLSALRSAIDLYNRTDAVTRQTIADNPQAALSRNFWNSIGQSVDVTPRNNAHAFPAQCHRQILLRVAGHVLHDCHGVLNQHALHSTSQPVRIGHSPHRGAIEPCQTAYCRFPCLLVVRIGRIAYRIGLYSLHLRHFVWRARTGDGGRGNHRRIHDQFSRYFARRGTEAFLRHEIRFVERNRLHIVAVHRTVRRLRHADQ